MKLGIMGKLMLLFCAMLVVSFAVMFVVNTRTFEEATMGALVEKARAITIEAENARQYMGDLRGKYNTFAEDVLLAEVEKEMAGRSFSTVEERLEAARRTSFYWTIPIVAGWTVGQTNADKANYEFRVPKVQPRNPKNEPNRFELAMLNELRTQNLDELFRVDEESNSLRYMRPIKLSENCMVCHGTVDDDTNGDGIDPLGFKMENWKVGEMHGAFEVVADLAPLQADVRSNLLQTLAIGGGILLLALLITFFVVRSNVTGLLDAVKDVLVQLTSSAGQVNSATQQMTQSSRDLADGASAQAASLEETASSLEEMAAMTRQNASSSAEADSLAGDAGNLAVKGTEAMTRMVASINEIKRSSDQTAMIIKTIDEIAFQTNLLALNAAVEAARAGDAGRGFAVVAEEVRNLAQRSAEAAKNTSVLIDDSKQKADAGVLVASEVEAVLTEITTVNKKVNELINSVSSASQDQSRGVEQINQAVTQMDNVTQSNAAAAEETSATSQELASQVEVLNALVERLATIVGVDQSKGRAAQAGGNGGSGGGRRQSLAMQNAGARPKAGGLLQKIKSDAEPRSFAPSSQHSDFGDDDFRDIR